MTEKEAEALRDWRKRLKAAHLCRNCKGQDAYTLNGRTYCAECAEKVAAAKRRWRNEHPGVNAKQVKERGDAWRAEGKCPACGGPVNDRRYKLCLGCRVYRRNRMRERRAGNSPRGANGYCWQCNKRPAVDGKRLCAQCYAMKLRCLAAMNPEKQAAARERIKEYEYRRATR